MQALAKIESKTPAAGLRPLGCQANCALPVLTGTPVPAEEPDHSGDEQERNDQDERIEDFGHDTGHFVRASVTVVTA